MKNSIPRWQKSRGAAVAAIAAFSLLFFVTIVAVSTPPALVAAGSASKASEWWESLPSSLSDVDLPQRAYMFDRNGKKIATFYGEDRVSIPYDKMGKNAVDALVATEDSRFWSHHGLDAQGVARALANNLLGDSTQGASTITQQLVENIRLRKGKNSAERQSAKRQTPKDKVEELRYSLAIEQENSKEEIMESYLNIVYFGNNAYGIEAAAQRYFSVKAKDLTVPQAATLIAMLKSPTNYDPITKPKESRLRRDVVMKRMVEVDMLEDQKYRKFIKKKTKLDVKTAPRGCGASEYPFYCQMVLNHILKSDEFGKSEKARQKFIDFGDWKITTALDPKTQGSSQSAVDRALGRDNQFGTSAVVVQPGTGEVLAAAQNRDWGVPENASDFRHTQIVYADSPSVQVGSTFKPITGVAAVEEGISPDTLYNAPSPAFFDGLDNPDGGYTNYDQGYGPINMATGFKYSVNTYFVALTQAVGVQDVATMARRLGMTSVPSDLTGREGSITLGPFETSPLQLANAYASMAARGVVCSPVMILKGQKIGQKGNIRVPSGDCHQEVSPAVMDTISYELEAPFSAGGTASALGIGRRATGKTGTTQTNAAVLFAGYTPQAATAVWVGDPRGGFAHPVEGIYAHGTYFSTSSGGRIPGPIWQDIMVDIHEGKPELWYPKPGGVSASMTSRIIPDVKGMEVNAAITSLLASGFTVDVAKKTAPEQEMVKSENYVWSQSPGAGGTMAYGDTVTLTLTDGSDVTIKIPGSYEELTGFVLEKEPASASPAKKIKNKEVVESNE